LKIFIELPTWLGDSVMTTPAVENLIATYPDAELTIFGSFVSTELFRPHPKVQKIVVDSTKKQKFRALALYKLAKEVGEFDLAISFRSHLATKILLFFLKSKKKVIFSKEYSKEAIHQVQKYNNFLNKITNQNLLPKDLKLYFKPTKYQKPTLGINAGATYGDAKRWYPERFAQVATALSDKFDIILFGGEGEREITAEIEELIKNSGVKNIQNLAGKTTIEDLASKIAGLSLFITNDSGPMHIASAYKIPTVAIFGPTKYKETSQWKNPKSVIVRKELDCSPCMKRSCPIKTHECMKSIGADEVLEAVERVL